MFDFSKGQLTNKEQSPNLGGFSFDSGIPDVAKRQEPITATGEALKLIGNMPSSVYSFGKGILSFLNPIKTAETVGQIIPETKGLIQEAGGVKEAGKEFIKGFPKTTYEVLVPSAARDLISAGYHFLTGDNSYSGVDVPLLRAEKAIVEDPVGQIAPFLIAAKYGANKAGYGKQFDTLIEKSASPIVKPISYVASKTGELAGKVASQTLGAITGAGPEAIKTAFKGGEEFKSALRGGVSESQLAQNAENAVNAVKNLRRDTYQNQLVEISKNPVSYDISPLHTELSTNLSKFKVVETGNSAKPLDFSRSTLLNDLEGQKTVTAIYRTMSDWGTKMGDRTAIGLDTLKRSFDNLIKPSKDSYAFSTAMKNSVKNILNKNVPGYEEMTSGYSKMSNLLDDIRGATGAGGKASSDTIVSKLTQAVRADKQFRIEMLKTMEGLSGQQLLDQIAGISLNSYIPRGLIGRGLDIYSIASIARGFISPAVFMELVLTSPRIVGEFVRALGLSNKVVSQILSDINNFRINPTVAQFLTKERQIKLGLGIEDVSKSPKIAPELEPLAQEARKFKSAEEFVNKMYIEPSYDLTPGITRLTKQKTTGLYHGTSSEGIQGILDTGKIETKISKLDRIGQKSISVTGSKGVAGSYGNIIFELDPKLKVIEPPTGVVKGDYYKGFEFRHMEDIPITKIRSAFIDIGKKENLNTKTIVGWKGRDPIYKTIGEVKNQLETKGIKTYVGNFADKSQLTDFYNQAVGKTDNITSISQAKASGQSFDEWVKKYDDGGLILDKEKVNNWIASGPDNTVPVSELLSSRGRGIMKEAGLPDLPVRVQEAGEETIGHYAQIEWRGGNRLKDARINIEISPTEEFGIDSLGNMEKNLLHELAHAKQITLNRLGGKKIQSEISEKAAEKHANYILSRTRSQLKAEWDKVGGVKE